MLLVPMILCSGLNSPGWLTGLRGTLYLYLPVYYKGCNLETAQWKRSVRQSMQVGVNRASMCSLGSVLSQNIDVFTNPEALWTPSSKGFLWRFHWVGCPDGWDGTNLPAMWQTRVQSLSCGDPQEKDMATHSCILAWRNPRTEEPDGLQSTGSQRVKHNWGMNIHTQAWLIELLAIGDWTFISCPSPLSLFSQGLGVGLKVPSL